MFDCWGLLQVFSVCFSVFIDHEVADSSFICPDSDHTASNCLRCPAHHGPAMGPCKEEFGWTYMQGRFDTVYKWECVRTEIEAPMILGSFLSNMSVQKKNSLNSSHFELSICMMDTVSLSNYIHLLVYDLFAKKHNLDIHIPIFH